MRKPCAYCGKPIPALTPQRRYCATHGRADRRRLPGQPVHPRGRPRQGNDGWWEISTWNMEVTGHGVQIAHCGAWYPVTTLPFTTPCCGLTLEVHP